MFSPNKLLFQHISVQHYICAAFLIVYDSIAIVIISLFSCLNARDRIILKLRT